MSRWPRTLLAVVAAACSSHQSTPPDAGSDAPPDAAQLDADLPTQCQPTAGGPVWILEGEHLTLQVSCDTGLVVAGSEFSIADLPDGAAYEPATRSLTWTPGLDQGAVYDLSIAVPSLGETGALRIGVLDRWDDPSNSRVVDPTTYTEEHALPVFHVETSPAINHDDYTPATITYGGHLYEAEAKYRGGASFEYPKRSYSLKFSADDPFSDPDRDFASTRKLTLTSPFDDNSYLRQRLAFAMWGLLDPDHIQIRTFSAVVFVDGEYRGLYEASDHVDRFLMDAHGLSPDGNLYKAVNHDANFRLTSSQRGGAPKTTLHDGYEKKEGRPAEGEPGAFDDLEALVAFVATAGDRDFLFEIGSWIDQRDYEDWWIFVSFIQADDSAGKNSYHYHDPLGGPFRYAPWDFNASFGQTWRSERQGPREHPEELTWANEIFNRFLAEPAIGPALRRRYGAILDGPYALGELTDLFDAMASQVHDSALRDEGRWAAEMQDFDGWSWRTDFTTHEEEIVYLREWIADRWAFVDGIY